MYIIPCSASMFSFFTDDYSKIGLVGRFVFGETDILVETECRIFYGKRSNALIKFVYLLYQFLCKIKKIVSHHMVEISILIHPFEIIVFFDRFEEGKGDLTNHTLCRIIY